jgi:hypothetical protein
VLTRMFRYNPAVLMQFLATGSLLTDGRAGTGAALIGSPCPAENGVTSDGSFHRAMFWAPSR